MYFSSYVFYKNKQAVTRCDYVWEMVFSDEGKFNNYKNDTDVEAILDPMHKMKLYYVL